MARATGRLHAGRLAGRGDLGGEPGLRHIGSGLQQEVAPEGLEIRDLMVEQGAHHRLLGAELVHQAALAQPAFPGDRIEGQAAGPGDGRLGRSAGESSATAVSQIDPPA
nr:hypothetical protein [Belnapia rosea]